MLSGKTISLKNIIAKVYMDLNIKDEDSLANILEWLGEAISNIKAHAQLESVSYCLNVCDNRAELPCDLLYLEEVNYNGIHLTKASGDTLSYNVRGDIQVWNQYMSVDIRKIANKCFEVANRYEIIPGGDNFIMENGWFKTSFPEGQVQIKYKRFKQDEDGFPLVPIEESYRSALFWYCAWKYFYIKKIQADNADFNKFHALSVEANQKWHWYCGQAGSEAMMPDLYMLENMKRNFSSLILKHNSFDKFFTNLNE